MYNLSRHFRITMSVEHHTNRKKWTYDEDIALLRQISAGLPFETSHGAIGANWDAMAVRIIRLNYADV